MQNSASEQQPISAIVLAAGKGKRLQSEAFDLPKVLRQAGGRSLIDWVLSHLDFIPSNQTVIVIGYQADRVREHVGPAYRYALQQEQLGTGHATAAAASEFAGYTGDVLVAYGDMPLVSRDTYASLVRRHQEGTADCTMLTAKVQVIPAYGRIVRDSAGRFREIVEERDCTPEQKLINEVNPGIYVFRAPVLFAALGRLRNDNAQGEYYLTDVPRLLREDGCVIDTVTIEDDVQVLGVNTLEDLAEAERHLSEREK